MTRGSFALVPCSLVLAIFAAAACESSSDDNKVTPDGGGGVFEAGPTPEAAPPIDAPADTGAACTPGGFQWATPGGGPGQNDTVYGVALDKDGSVWITGTFIGSAKWGAVALTGADTVHTTAFVAKLDATGKVLFARALGGDQTAISNIGQRVRLDADGNAYVVGTYEKELKVGTVVDLMQDNAGTDGAGFVLKLDKDGNPLWGITTSNQGGSREAGRDVAIDTNGDVYFTGHYNGAAKFVSTPGGGPDDIVVNAVGGGASDEAVFLAKYSQATKKWLWAKGWSGGGNDGGLGLGVVATADGVTITGQISGKLDVDGTLLTSADGAFLIKASKDDGHVLWATQVAQTGQNVAHAVAATADAAGNVYLTGAFEGTATFESAAIVDDAGADDAGAGALSLAVTDSGQDMFIAKYDGNGKPVWAKHAGAANAITRGNDIAFDGTDGLYVTGFKQGSTIFDPTTTLTHSGNLWVARYDTSGTLKWATGNDSQNVASGEGNSVSVRSPSSGLVVGGGFNAMTTFGAVQVTTAGEDDGVVARLCN